MNNQKTSWLAAAGYEQLAAVLQDAHDQAAYGKGDERHANGLPFHEQRMQQISAQLDSDKGMAFQVCKKMTEGLQFDDHARRERELLGAINYLAGIVIFHRLRQPDSVTVEPDWPAGADDRMDVIGQNGPTGEHYQIDWLHEAPADATHWDDYECEWLKTLGGAWFSWSGTSWLQTEIDPDYLADLIPRPHPLQEFAHLAPAWADRLLQPGGSRIVYAQNADGYGEKIAVSDQSHGFEQALILKR